MDMMSIGTAHVVIVAREQLTPLQYLLRVGRAMAGGEDYRRYSGAYAPFYKLVVDLEQSVAVVARMFFFKFLGF